MIINGLYDSGRKPLHGKLPKLILETRLWHSLCLRRIVPPPHKASVLTAIDAIAHRLRSPANWHNIEVPCRDGHSALPKRKVRTYEFGKPALASAAESGNQRS